MQPSRTATAKERPGDGQSSPTPSIIRSWRSEARTSERQGRAIDRDGGSASMEKKKQEGYF